MEVIINLNQVESVKSFCETAYMSDCDITLRSGIYVINGKSILGVFSLDLSKPITCEFTGSQESVNDFKSKLEVMNVLV